MSVFYRLLWTEKMPPLNALRTFEAAARHLSFTKAAAELFVTQAAVSRQIRLLEQNLGRSLFTRAHRAVRLTPEGRGVVEHYRGTMQKALKNLAD